MSIYPKPSAPPLEPDIQFQHITYPQYIANSQIRKIAEIADYD